MTKKTHEGYQQHLRDVMKVIETTYGENIAATARSFTQVRILPPIALMAMMGKDVPDPEYIAFSVAKALNDRYAKDSDPVMMADGLGQSIMENPQVMFSILDEAMELTRDAGYGDIEEF